MARNFDYSRLSRAIKQNTRIPIYSVLILTCSLLSLPEDYKLDKQNPLNQYFVKLGWFWTSSLVLSLLLLSTRVDDKESVARITYKWFASTILWYLSTSFFEYMDKNLYFDISGHTFLLIFSNLIISSELRLLNAVGRTNSGIGGTRISTIKSSLLVLSILWDFMLLQTALYYHTILQKLIAATWAVGSWYILHIIFYEESLEKSNESRSRDGHRHAKEITPKSS